jgi:hypothetical protein
MTRVWPGACTTSRWSTGSTTWTKARGGMTSVLACPSAEWSPGGVPSRARRSSARCCRVHAIAVTVYGGQLSVGIEARTTIPVAATGVPSWSLTPSPPNTARAVHVHVLVTGLTCALATAYRLLAAPDDLGKAPVG